MRERVNFCKLPCVFAAVILLSAIAFTQESQKSGNEGQIPVSETQENIYHQQMRSLMEELKNAKTDEQREAIHEKIAQARKHYRASHPVRELTFAEKEAAQRKMEEELKKDPFRWQIYQLRRSMSNARNPEERESSNKQIKELQAKHTIDEEAKLTSEQRTAAQAKQKESAKLETELKPFREQLHTAKTNDEHQTIRAQMREIFKKYQ